MNQGGDQPLILEALTPKAAHPSTRFHLHTAVNPAPTGDTWTIAYHTPNKNIPATHQRLLSAAAPHNVRHACAYTRDFR